MSAPVSAPSPAASGEPAPHLDVGGWSDAPSRDLLQLVTASVAQMVGFEVAVISIVHQGALFPVAVSGGEEVGQALRETSTPVEVVAAELEHADDWDRFQFVPHERNGFDITSYGWTPDLTVSENPHAWHPHDMLLAPLYDLGGELAGMLSIDVPANGHRPDAHQRELLERYAAQAESALRIAFERDALAHRLQLAETTRQVVRLATSQTDLRQALHDCREALMVGFRADLIAVRAYADPADPVGTPDTGTPSFAPSQEGVPHVRDAVRRCWAEQRVAVIAPEAPRDPAFDDAGWEMLTSFAETRGLPQAMVVPIGAGGACLGHLLLYRSAPLAVWSADERESCLDVARDIGNAILASHNLSREQRLVDELRELATYKSELLSTVSHELKNPLGALTGHLELLADQELPAEASFSVSAMGRAARRITRLVDNLLVLAEVADPDTHRAAGPVSLATLLTDAAELLHTAAVRRGLEVDVEVADPGSAVARGDAEQLDRVVTNLVSNAVKYTPPGGRVRLGAGLRADGDVEVSVADSGIGISTEDQARLFTEFFRSTNPEATSLPGTGLGLAICARIVAQHGGRIEVDSQLGRGSTFRVVLPRPA